MTPLLDYSCRTEATATARTHLMPRQPYEFTGERVIESLTYDPTDMRIARMERWAVCLFVDPEDPKKRVTAEVIGFPGVASEGDGEEEALTNLHEALELALDEPEGVRVSDRRYVVPPGATVAYMSMQRDG